MITGETVYSYDEVPYPDFSYAQTHPDRLATLGILLGMHPAPVEACRVLELGCAAGGNLIPMAYGLPGSRFVGVDLSARQIAAGRAVVETLGLTNVRLEYRDILDIDGSFGEFDYIIAHGVYSWVPEQVQEKVLSICRHNLAPNGIAYVSYNTYPGWHVLGSIREMMLYHTRKQTDPQKRALEARRLLTFLAQAVPAESGTSSAVLNAYAAYLNAEMERLQNQSDSFLLHDELEAVNEPIYFHQFVERAARHGLQYLVEAEFRSAMSQHLTSEVAGALREMAEDIVEMEQYMDFLRNRTFRQTLLCHDGIELDRILTPDRLTSLYVASPARPLSDDPQIHTTTVEKFQAPDGAILSTDHPVSKAAMLHLREIWPRAIQFDRLLETARTRLGLDSLADAEKRSADARALGENLLRAYAYSDSLVRLHVHAPHVATEVSEWPVASPVSRLQAEESRRVTNLYHERVNLDPFGVYLLPRLDGTRNRDQLVDDLLQGPVANGALVVQADGDRIEDPCEMRRLLEEEVEQCLQWLMHAALLVA